MLLGYFFFFFLQTWNKEKNHKPTQPKNHAFFSHWTGAKEERGRKWGGYAKHQNVQWSKWEIFKPKQQLSARILTVPKKLFHAQKHTEQERGILTKMTWTSSVFSPAGDFQASRMWRKIKKPPQLQRNVRIRWSACYLLVFGYCERWRNNPENHLQQEIIPDSSVQSTWWYKKPFLREKSLQAEEILSFITNSFPGTLPLPNLPTEIKFLQQFPTSATSFPSRAPPCPPPGFQHCWAQAILASSHLIRIFLA